MDPTVLGERVRTLRLRRNLTQDQLAQVAGIATNTLRGLEKGTLQTRRAIYLKVVAALGTTADALERAMDPINESHPLLNGLNDDDLRIAQAYSRARTAMRVHIERLLLSGITDIDRGCVELCDLYLALDPERRKTIRETAANHLKIQTEERQGLATKTKRQKKP